LVRDEHAKQDGREDEIRPGEFPLGEDVPVQRTQDGRDDRSWHNHDDAVLEIGRQLAEGFNEIVKMQPGFWQAPHGLQADFIKTLEAGHQHHVQWNQVKDGHQHQGNVDQVTGARAVHRLSSVFKLYRR